MKPKPTIYFSPDAWVRVQALVNVCDDEIGWHGLAELVRDAKGSMLGVWVREIFVPSQTASSVTVDVDDESAFEYLDDLTKRGKQEEAANIRYWGHSHVNMGTSPSGTDTKFWRDAMNMNGKPEFFAATIHNKKGEAFGRVCFYFPEFGVFEEDADVCLGIPGHVMDDARATVKAKLKTRPVVASLASAYATFGKDDDEEEWRRYYRDSRFQPLVEAPPPKRETPVEVPDDPVDCAGAYACDDDDIRLAFCAFELDEMSDKEAEQFVKLPTRSAQSSWARKHRATLENALQRTYGTSNPDKLCRCDLCGELGEVEFDGSWGYCCEGCRRSFAPDNGGRNVEGGE